MFLVRNGIECALRLSSLPKRYAFLDELQFGLPNDSFESHTSVPFGINRRKYHSHIHIRAMHFLRHHRQYSDRQTRENNFEF